MVKLRGTIVRTVEDFRVNRPEQWRMWERGKEVCASRMEQVEGGNGDSPKTSPKAKASEI